ncbi:MAG: glycosyltransferase [Ignavibacteriae bacterium]|nr:MAG: glycosyltransferase [Ignavibacteriota bacterium]
MNFNTGIVIFNPFAFGGSPKRFANLFKNLNNKYPGRFYLFIDYNLYHQLKEIIPDMPFDDIYIINLEGKQLPTKEANTGKKYIGLLPDPLVIDKQHSVLRKIYWFYKNKTQQRNIFYQLEYYRKKLDIKVFNGVFSGVLPLVFYLKKEARKAAVVFSDMDSWFSDVHSDMNKLWYRKYYSFNYALENADVIDFLSPYILEGVKQRNVKVKEESVEIAPCSFIDYSKCKVEEKEKIEIAFCGRLEPDKNPMLYLEAAKIIHKKYPEAKFHLFGEGSLEADVKEFIVKNSLQDCVNFRFHNNPPEIFSRTGVFVSLQTHTNYPSQSVLEAMACGNAIIASSRGDTELFINPENGVLVELNVNDVVSALEKLIENWGKTKEMGLYAREYAKQNHTIDKVLEYYTGLYKKAYHKVFNIQ